MRVADGTAEVRAAGGPVDCVISADPVTFLLVVYGRMPLGRALLRGGMLAWGRRPWLGLCFKDLFFNPWRRGPGPEPSEQVLGQTLGHGAVGAQLVVGVSTKWARIP